MKKLSDGPEVNRKGTAQAQDSNTGSQIRNDGRDKQYSSNEHTEKSKSAKPYAGMNHQYEGSIAANAVPEQKNQSNGEFRPQRQRICARPGKKKPKTPDAIDKITRAKLSAVHVSTSSEKNDTYQNAPHQSANGKNPSGNLSAGRIAHSANAPRSGFAKRKHSPIYAALDLGTNNCRLMIAVPKKNGKFQVIDGFSQIVRLGEGLSRTGRLGNEAMNRTISALKQCAVKLRARNIRKSRLIATEACRQAQNGPEFLSRVKKETGLELEIVSRETEAYLAANGCGSLMDPNSDAAVMFDIGGGSTELILVHGPNIRQGGIRDRVEAWTSLPMGVVTLAERFGGRDITQEGFREMVDFVREELLKFSRSTKFATGLEQSKIHLLGTSGTVTTLAGIHLRLERYERRRVDGLWMNCTEIDTVISELLSMDHEMRKRNPCIGNERADLVLPGCAIFEAIRAIWPTERLRIADRGLREGLLSELIYTDRNWRFHWNRQGRWQNRRGR